ncbi:MAG: hypothetical protein QXE31_00595 [Candidatus Woesearchaeota archaeon]
MAKKIKNEIYEKKINLEDKDKIDLIVILLFSIALSFVVEISYFFAKELFEIENQFFTLFLWILIIIVFFISLFLIIRRYFFK